jgi:3-dehydroquinate dehydratase
MPKYQVEIPCIEHYLIDAESAEDAVKLITEPESEEDVIDVYDITYIGEAMVREVIVQ